MGTPTRVLLWLTLSLSGLTGCIDYFAELPPRPDAEQPTVTPAEGCMICHNGAEDTNDYSGDGLLDPHPFPGAEALTCTTCHGGDGAPLDPGRAHVPPPPTVGDRRFQGTDDRAFFNRITLAGIDRLTPDPYPGPDGRQHTNLDYLQFVNPGDLRVVAAKRGCGAEDCHGGAHAEWVPRSLHATNTGIFSATRFAVGVDNRVPESRGRDGDSLADTAPRAVANPDFDADDAAIGEVARLAELPERAQLPALALTRPPFRAEALEEGVIDAAEDPARPDRIRADSPLETLVDEQLAITCGGCHLWSAGANNRYGDFRASGCTACHMPYSLDGRYRGRDGNIRADEPAYPDGLAPGERPHVQTHQIRSVARTLPDGTNLLGIDDTACVGCHQGSNQTVLQYWGIRLDQNADLTQGTQYPAQPDSYADTGQDARLYDFAIDNATFNGRGLSQYLLIEDYDGDGRDDTPPDIHYELGLSCIDCHGSRDLHGGTPGDASSGRIQSRMDQETRIACESCHGDLDAYAPTTPCTTHDGRAAECAVDRAGNPLRHVTKDADGHYWLLGRVDGRRRYVSQIRDVVVDTGRSRPDTFRDLYSPKASYAMGRNDGDPATGTGPLQWDGARNIGYSHLDRVDCVACHAAWTNNCVGCHLASEVDTNPLDFSFSNITGARIALDEYAADFVYQSPVLVYLGVDSRGRVSRMSPAEKAFWRFTDSEGDTSRVFTFGDRLGLGSNPTRSGRGAEGALGLNPMSPHSIRGKVDGRNEGPLYCVGCHINVDMLNDVDVMTAYATFGAAYDAGDYAALDFELLARHIGNNPGNQLNSPFYVRMAAGLGTGLFLFDEDGCPINPLDQNENRQFCNDAPAAEFADQIDAVAYDLDRVVEPGGFPNASTTHPRLTPDGVPRVGASNPQMAGPLGGTSLILLVGNGDPNNALVLDSWLDADAALRGDADLFVE